MLCCYAHWNPHFPTLRQLSFYFSATAVDANAIFSGSGSQGGLEVQMVGGERVLFYKIIKTDLNYASQNMDFSVMERGKSL